MIANRKIHTQNQQKPLRLMPGIIIVILQWLVRFGIPVVAPAAVAVGVMGGVLGGLAIFVWWAFFSRAPRVERWGGVLLMVVILSLTFLLIDESIATGGQGMMFFILAIPVLSLAFVIWAVATHLLSNNVRRLTMIATILLACGFWTLLRSNGITGDFKNDFAWRWAETSEERLLEKDKDSPSKFMTDQAEVDNIAEWPGFRGVNRDGIIRGVQINSDWSSTPPEELWRRPIGPGCSSFAVSGELLYTQEQRGEDEIVSCYNLNTGEHVWSHSDKARFWDSHAGAGPRSTPALSGGRVYTVGASGILNALNASDGSVIWSRNAVSDNDVEHSGWGISGSPMVVNDVVVVAVVGKLAAYDIATGDLRWQGPDGDDGYSSPHLLTIDGIRQILLTSAIGATSLDPANGKLLWQYQWQGSGRIVQPAMIEDGDLLITKGDGMGLRRISVKHESGDWNIEEAWTSTQIKPNFNDLVVHKGHAYGYIGPMLVCIDLKNGRRKWRSGRYGGQILLLADQDLLLVLSEKGEVVLINAVPDKFTELARLQAITGKTWNHPVLVDDILLVRNTQEMVAFRLQSQK